MTLSEALVEIKNNKVIKRSNCNTSYCFDTNTKKFGMMIKHNQHEGVKYDIKYAERDTITFYPEDLLADDWMVIQFGEVAEWSIATVLKTVNVKAFAGSNPVLSFQENTMKSKFISEVNESILIECLSNQRLFDAMKKILNMSDDELNADIAKSLKQIKSQND